MTSYPLVPDRLTTKALADEVERQTCCRPTTPQLRYWAQEGLLPEPQQLWPGRNHGRGSVVLWEAECVDRLIIMLHTRKGKNLSVERAARVLVVKGYLPTKPGKLRTVLKGFLFDVEQYARKNRTFLERNDLSPQEQQRRLVESLKQRRHNRDVSEPMRTLVSQSAAAVMGFPTDSGPSDFQALSRILSFDALREQIDAISDEELAAAYADANAAVTDGLPLVLAFAQAISPMSGVTPERDVATLRLDSSSPLAKWLATNTEISFVDVMRFLALPPLIARRVALQRNPEAFEVVSQHYGAVLEGLLTSTQRSASPTESPDAPDATDTTESNERESTTTETPHSLNG